MSVIFSTKKVAHLCIRINQEVTQSELARYRPYLPQLHLSKILPRCTFQENRQWENGKSEK
eukprot:scaffold10504_cov20-Tisochrysis_lutea.AAC.1